MVFYISVILTFSFISILFIWVLLVSLARDLSILLIFKKTALDFIDHFCFFSKFISLCSLYYFPSFCWVWTLFSNSLKWWLFVIFLVSWGRLVSLWTSLLGITFNASHRLCKVVFSFSFFKVFSGLFFWFLSLTLCFLVVCCLVSVCLFFLQSPPPRLISNFIPLWSEKLVEIISILLNLLRLALWPCVWSILKNVFIHP